jgi:2-aminobenzoate-CoA ligase
MVEPTGHVDTFCADRLPPRELWPVREWTGIPELTYPPRLNAAAEFVDRAVANGFGARCALRWPGGEWTYDELLEHANRFARVLVEDLGVVPGNRVLLRGPNNATLAACWLAVLKAGGVVVCTMPLLRERELQYVADKAGISLALTDARFADACDAAFRARRDGTPRSGARVVRFNDDASGSLEALARGKAVTFENCDTAAEDTAIIAFTSGTTGEGKGTMHAHRDLLAITDCFPRYVLQPSPDDVFCGSPPLAFTYALGGLLLFPLRIGASALLLEQATPPFLIKAIAERRPTICFTAPTAYRAMLGLLAEHDVSSLRKCVSAGEHLPLAVFEEWRRATGLSIIDGIGATEMLHIFIGSPEDSTRPGSTGRPVPGYEARIIDEDGREVPPGTIGRLAVRGPTGCRYLADARQEAYVQHGWNVTGDAYLMDAYSYFWYQARSDDMIVSAGYNIAGPEVEAALLSHPAVAECGVVGAPDEERGEIVTAYVVLHSGRDRAALTKELQEHVKATIAPYKYPRRIVYVDELPKTLTGKLQRFALRRMAAGT